ncbi:Glyoxylase, beta-lactamase superfamily II [Paracoccus isoporae]|uniref:Glyoxylase, beta-lactamase superfamily II n=1 Tax=Paracoccus isoporae TaxID=591205 RepID=A0A1G6Z1U8_9RHOB|nr:MBL fold metallo-hydrolase [Paracoccus isoporae]SDD96600.1 Glyoxylase, beta-lactamase superfamily II [Paracoccus isoporae]
MSAEIRHPWAEPPGPGEAIEVAPGVVWMRLPLPMKLDHVNVYALDEGDGWTLVDTGFDTAKNRAIWQTLLDGPLHGQPVRRVIVTHHHPDHVGLAGWFADHGAEIWATRTAWLTARMLVLDEQDAPPPQSLAFWRAAGMPPEMLAQRAGERPFNFSDCVHPIPLGYRRICDGQTVRFGGRDWRVATGDGHAPEHATFWSLGDDLVIGGDQLLPGISPNLGVYPTEPEADPVGEWLESCDRFAAMAEDRHLVLPGHKLAFTGLPLRLNQMRENHVSALDRVHRALSEQRLTAVGCFPALFKRPIGAGEFGLALVESVGHLNRLAQEGRITRAGTDDHGGVLWRAAA